ncbi:AASDH [Mytilus coruscus]|uniref:AASDH n=1 Tax=Mytilus coruscus TaxID=42192 RepID=A0A6J8D175_MYTCO|nr:AASDH [Mytilus coruscus]
MLYVLRDIKNNIIIFSYYLFEGRQQIRVQIIFQNEDDVERTIDILNSLKDNINEGLSGIEFIVATKGSIVLYVDILLEMMETDELLQSTLTLFLRKIVERITISATESIKIVLLPINRDFKQLYAHLEYTQWNVSKPIRDPVYLDFDVEAQFFEIDDIMEEQLGQISNALIKHSNGNETNNNITATLLPICVEKISNEEAFGQAQTPVKYNLPVSVSFRQQLSIKLSRNEELNIYDCIKIGNTLVFTEYNYNKHMFCNSDGTDLHHISVSYTPHYITYVDSNTVAVSCNYDKNILIINTSTGSVTSTINTSDLCRGISYNNNNLDVIIGGRIIHVIDLTGKVVRTIPLPSDTIFDITVDRERLVCVEYISVYCCSLDGNLIWKFENERYQDFRRDNR